MFEVAGREEGAEVEEVFRGKEDEEENGEDDVVEDED